MHLDVKSKAIACESFDEVEFPQGAAGVQRMAMQPGHHDTKLPLTTRLRQR